MSCAFAFALSPALALAMSPAPALVPAYAWPLAPSSCPCICPEPCPCPCAEPCPCTCPEIAPSIVLPPYPRHLPLSTLFGHSLPACKPLPLTYVMCVSAYPLSKSAEAHTVLCLPCCLTEVSNLSVSFHLRLTHSDSARMHSISNTMKHAQYRKTHESQIVHVPTSPCHTALVGALGITPIDFVLPLAMYIFLRKPTGWKLWLNWTLMIFYICIMIIGAVAAIRGIVLDACKSPLQSWFSFVFFLCCSVHKLLCDFRVGCARCFPGELLTASSATVN